MKKVSLKDLETIIGSQILIDTLLTAAKRDILSINQETIDRAIFITKSSLNDLVEQYQKRSNDAKTKKMLGRCNGKLFIEVANG